MLSFSSVLGALFILAATSAPAAGPTRFTQTIQGTAGCVYSDRARTHICCDSALAALDIEKRGFGKRCHGKIDAFLDRGSQACNFAIGDKVIQGRKWECDGELKPLAAGGKPSRPAHGSAPSGISTSRLNEALRSYSAPAPSGLLEAFLNAHPHSGISPAAVKEAFEYFEENAGKFSNRNFITIIDFDKSSNQKRMFIIDIREGRGFPIQTYMVAHGKNSGGGEMATRFSNREGSLQSSLGAYETGGDFISGSHGRALKLKGLEDTNSNAEERDIILHGADYVSDGHAGHSWGCPAVDPDHADEIINKIQDGSLMYVYSSHS